MKQSLRKRLLAASLAMVAPVLLVAGLVLYQWVATRVNAEFDQALLARAQALIMLSGDDAAQAGIDPRRVTAAEAATQAPPLLFELWAYPNRLIARSRALQGQPLPDSGRRWRAGKDYFFDTLPDGRAGRFVRVVFTPAQTAPGAGAASAPLSSNLKLLVGMDRAPLERQLLLLKLVLAASALGILGLISGLLSFAIRLGLRPLDELGRRFDDLRPANLAEPAVVKAQWLELVPISRQFTRLVRRLDAGFARERETSSQIAAELRAPIIELSELATDARGHSDDARQMREFVPRVLAGSRAMQRSVDSLLAIAHAEAESARPQIEVVMLATLVREVWEGLAQRAENRGKRLAATLPTDLIVYSDPALLTAIVNQLLDNALSYSPPAAIIRCMAAADGDTAVITIGNPAPGLSPADLPRMFNRLWRKDGIVADHLHSGMGLPLVRLYADALGLSIEHRLSEQGAFTLTLAGLPRVTQR